MYKSSLSYSCSFLWNKLPIELRSNHSLASFKKDCKNYILLNSITNDYKISWPEYTLMNYVYQFVFV